MMAEHRMETPAVLTKAEKTFKMVIPRGKIFPF